MQVVAAILAVSPPDGNEIGYYSSISDPVKKVEAALGRYELAPGPADQADPRNCMLLPH